MTDTRRSRCPIANSLDIIGDKWSLLLIRDMLFQNKRYYKDFLHSQEGIATNILADRLKRLVESGMAQKLKDPSNPSRPYYEPTQKARDLAPVLIEYVRWANRHIDDTIEPPAAFLEKIRQRFAA